MNGVDATTTDYYIVLAVVPAVVWQMCNEEITFVLSSRPRAQRGLLCLVYCAGRYERKTYPCECSLIGVSALRSISGRTW